MQHVYLYNLLLYVSLLSVPVCSLTSTQIIQPTQKYAQASNTPLNSDSYIFTTSNIYGNMSAAVQ